MASGVPLLEALRIAGQVLTNLVLQEDTRVVAERVEEGSSLNRAPANSGHFPPMMVHMVASGGPAASWRPCCSVPPPTRSGSWK